MWGLKALANQNEEKIKKVSNKIPVFQFTQNKTLIASHASCERKKD